LANVKSFWLAIIILVSLIGLMGVQLQLLYSGIRVEKAKLDRQVYTALVQIEEQVNQSDHLLEYVLSLQQSGHATANADQLRQYAEPVIKNSGLDFDFSIAITESYLGLPVLADEGFSLERVGSFRSYSHRLGGQLQQQCQCDLLLHLQAHNFFPILLQRLYPLVVPLAGFLLMVVLCLVLLYRSVNQQKRLSRIKNDFINNLAHELKTPTFSTALLLRLLRTSLQSGQLEKSNSYLQLMEQENTAIKSHIDKVLELASLEGGKYQLERKPLVIGPLLERVAASFTHMVEDKGGYFRYQFEVEGVQVMADEVHLQNAIQNLLDNALKYGGVPPVIQCSASRAGKKLHITVCDNGTGIAARERKRIFQKFYRINNGSAAPAKGFGLGLNYTRQVIRAHGGRVELVKASEKGSSFIISLPIKTVNYESGTSGRRQ